MLVNRVGKSDIQLYQNNSTTEPYDPERLPERSKQVAKAVRNSTIHFETAKIAAGIITKYEIRNSTAKEMATMSEELYQAGIISQEEYQAMAYQKKFHFDYFNLAEKYPEIELEALPKRDFVKVWEETRVSEIENKNYRKAARAVRIVNILENLQSINGHYN